MIHPSAIIKGNLDIAEGAEIGPYCIIQGNVKIGKGSVLEGHVTLGSPNGVLILGENNRISAGAVIGGPPQDLGYKGEETQLIIGDHNVFREFSSINLATTKGDKKTELGNHCYLMSYTHIGHDCKIGNNVVISNDSHVGGHCEVSDNVTIGGMCAFNQFVRIGKSAFVAGGSVVVKDILPFSRAHGNHAFVRATNKVGLLRKGYSKAEVQNIHRAIRIFMMGSDTVQEAVDRIKSECEMSEHIHYFLKFVSESKRGIARPKGRHGEDEE